MINFCDTYQMFFHLAWNQTTIPPPTKKATWMTPRPPCCDGATREVIESLEDDVPMAENDVFSVRQASRELRSLL
jgi:hypothetical protein